MVIEVKGGRVQRVGGQWESVDGDGTAHHIKDPFAQVTGALHPRAVDDWCEHSTCPPRHTVSVSRA